MTTELCRNAVNSDPVWGYSGTVITMTKVSGSDIAETIIIANDAPNIKLRLGGYHIFKFSNRKRSGSFSHFAASRDNIVAIAILVNHETLSVSVEVHFLFENPRNLSCWHSASIINSNHTNDVIPCPIGFNSKWSYAQVGTLQNSRILELKPCKD